MENESIALTLVRPYTRFMPHTDPIKIAQRVVEISSDQQATNIIMLDITDLASFADYFVVLPADSMRLITALVSAIVLHLKNEDQ